MRHWLVTWSLIAATLAVSAAVLLAAQAARPHGYLDNQLPYLLSLAIHEQAAKAVMGTSVICAALIAFQIITATTRRLWQQHTGAAGDPPPWVHGASVVPGVLLVLAVYLGFRFGLGPRASGTAAVAATLVSAALQAFSPATLVGRLVQRLATRVGPRIRCGIGLACVALLLALWSGWLHELRPIASGPNVVVFVLDTVRWQNVSTFGRSRETTPNLNRIFRDGLVFENAFAIAPWTLPNHASMFTGFYACQHGATQETESMPAQPVTISEILYQAGYDTVAFSNNPNVSKLVGFGQGFQDFYDLWLTNIRGGSMDSGEVPDGDAGAATTDAAIRDWLAGRRDKSRPYFMFVNFIEAHAPYDPPQEFGREYLPEGTDRSRLRPHILSYDYLDYLSGRYQMSAEDFSKSQDLYDGEIRYLDARVGSLVDFLQQAGELDDTMLVVTADHGEFFGDHGLVGHQFGLYDTALHVPLMIRFPKVIRAGQRPTAGVMLHDLFATIVEVTGVQHAAALAAPARSLLSADEGRDLFAEYYRPIGYLRNFRDAYPEFDASRFDRRVRSIRRGEYKLIWSSDGAHELYNVAHDPMERQNLVEREPDKVAELSAGLAQWLEGCSDQPLEASERAPALEDPELRARLRALGYSE